MCGMRQPSWFLFLFTFYCGFCCVQSWTSPIWIRISTQLRCHRVCEAPPRHQHRYTLAGCRRSTTYRIAGNTLFTEDSLDESNAQVLAHNYRAHNDGDPDNNTWCERHGTVGFGWWQGHNGGLWPHEDRYYKPPAGGVVVLPLNEPLRDQHEGPPQRAPNITGFAQGKVVVALYIYNARDDGDLSFRKRDRL
ncbi:hypothetical protein MRX96_008074 [Rhipicephalus microplus]